MSAVGTTYSFKDLVGSLNNPNFGVSFSLTGGNVGLGQVTIRMVTERTAHDTASDGVVMPSYLAGDSGDVDIEVQQTSALHHALLSLYNQLTTAANNDDVSGWASTLISFRTLTDGSTHICNGVSFSKIPDKPYQAAGQKITWRLMAANVINM
jgi:hypothetical protein